MVDRADPIHHDITRYFPAPLAASFILNRFDRLTEHRFRVVAFRDKLQGIAHRLPHLRHFRHVRHRLAVLDLLRKAGDQRIIRNFLICQRFFIRRHFTCHFIVMERIFFVRHKFHEIDRPFFVLRIG